MLFASGVFYYFPVEQVKALAQGMADSFPGGVNIQRHFSDHRNDAQRLCVAGVHAGQKGWLQGMADH